MGFKHTSLILSTICFLLIFETAIFSQTNNDSKTKQSQETSPTQTLTSNGEKKSGPTITFESKVQDLGEMGPGTKASCEFKFTNTGDDVLKIKKVSKTCGCTTSKLAKKEYAPGESGTLKITYNASTHPASIKKNIYVESNDKKNPKVTLSIKAKIVAKVEHVPDRIQLLPRKENAGCPEITLKSKDDKLFSIMNFKSTSNVLKAKTDPSKKEKRYVIQPEVDLEKVKKAKNGRITIQLDHPKCKTISIPYKVIPEFQTKPAGLTLLKVQPEKPITRELWVLSNYNEDFEIESVTSQRGYAKVTNQEKV
jgi:hypothetical protein